MTTVKRISIVASMSILVLAPASTVKALVVKSGSTTYFADEFEGALGDIGLRSPGTGDAWIEFYNPPKPNNGSTLTVETDGAFEGSNFLRVLRPGGGAGAAIADFTGEHTSGTISAEFMLRVADVGKEWNARAAFHNSGAPGYVAGFIIGNESGSFDIQLDRDTGSNGNYTRTDTNTDFPDDGEWHKVFMEYARDTSTLGISIDNGTLLTVNDVFPGNIDEMRFHLVSNSNEFHIDALVSLDTTFNWSGAPIGDWNSGQSWTELGLPNRNDHTAIFGDNIASPATVVTNSEVTVRQIRFDSPAGYAVAGQGSIHLESQSVGIDAAVQVLQAATAGGHQFQVPVHLDSDATVDVMSSAALVFHNAVNLNGNVLTKTGEGTMSIRNDLILAGGSVSLAQGALSGNGTVGGDVINGGGTISPGNSTNGSGQAVPEPGALGLLLLAAMMCSLFRWNHNC